MYSYVCTARAEERVRRGDHRSAHAGEEGGQAADLPSTLSATNGQAPATSRQASGALLYSPLFSAPLHSASSPSQQHVVYERLQEPPPSPPPLPSVRQSS